MREFADVVFKGSFERLNQCPFHNSSEFAFIGRSNVGKSSLINTLIRRKNMAHTSSTPGKTQHLNYYHIDKSWYLVDLPGYGFAKVSKTSKAKWKKMINSYLMLRPNLCNTFILIDSRHQLQENDLEMINWFGEHAKPFSIVYTKFDKLKVTGKMDGIEKTRSVLREYWEPLPKEFITSSETGEGREPLLEYIDELVANFELDY